MATSEILTDHARIRRWAEARQAKPACVVTGTGGTGCGGRIRLDFPGYSGGDSLQAISWEEWFTEFDKHGLALVIQQDTADGQRGNFNTLVSREGLESGDRFAMK